eukprot:m.70462 g.70462  ORF g.70462 m.70462 type:complete len:62 (+) comp8646_c0_seq2:3353-3538(+)
MGAANGIFTGCGYAYETTDHMHPDTMDTVYGPCSLELPTTMTSLAPPTSPPLSGPVCRCVG